MSTFDLYAEMARLVDAWCDRRALRPLRILLPAWPPPMGLTDDLSELLAALRHVRAMCRDELPAAEREAIRLAITDLQRSLFQ